jgi:hypothetical protein
MLVMKIGWTHVVVGIVIVLCVIAAAVYGHRYETRVAYLRWISQRQQDLRSVGRRIPLYRAAHNGSLPSSLEEAIQGGLLYTDELKFREPQGNVLVVREFHIPHEEDGSGSPVFLTERYPDLTDSYSGQTPGTSVLYTDGRVYFNYEWPR